jgi:hypothetical protein
MEILRFYQRRLGRRRWRFCLRLGAAGGVWSESESGLSLRLWCGRGDGVLGVAGSIGGV